MKRKLDEVEFSSEKAEQGQATKNGKFIENGESYDPYAMSKSHKLPVWLKACFTKWWVAGMVFYFIFFGLGYVEILGGWLFAVVLGAVWGCVTDVFVNHAFRGFDAPGLNYKKYIFMGKERGYVSLPVNILYGAFISYVACSEILYNLLYLICANTGADLNELLFYAGPFAYAFLMLALDMAFIAIRNAIDKAIVERKNKNTN